MVPKDEVATLFPTDRIVSKPHCLDNIAVTHSGPDDLAPGGDNRFIQSEITHDGGDQGLACKCAAVQGVERRHGKNLVPIDNLPLLIAKHKPIGITIVRDADLGTCLFDQAANFTGMGASARRIDIHTVGVGVEYREGRTEFTKNIWRRPEGGSVGTIDGYLHPVE